MLSLQGISDNTWINVDGLRKVEIIDKLRREQVSLVLGRNFVISFQERVGDIFDQIRNRIRNAKGRIRSDGPDYLLYALVDAIVDNYFLVLEKLGEKIESVQEELLSEAGQSTLQETHRLKREMISLHKSIWPLREVIGGMQRWQVSVPGRCAVPAIPGWMTEIIYAKGGLNTVAPWDHGSIRMERASARLGPSVPWGRHRHTARLLYRSDGRSANSLPPPDVSYR